MNFRIPTRCSIRSSNAFITGATRPVALIGDPEAGDLRFPRRGCFHLPERGAHDAGTAISPSARTGARKVGLVRAVNAIFERADSFQLDEIRFRSRSRRTARGSDATALHGGSETPFHSRHLARGRRKSCRSRRDGDRPAARPRRHDRRKKLEPGHIAVLTSTNAQAAEMQIALRARRVPSVLYSSANVFTTHEAREMRALLAAAVQPGNEKLVRAALCTDALGFTGNEIDALRATTPPGRQSCCVSKSITSFGATADSFACCAISADRARRAPAAARSTPTANGA